MAISEWVSGRVFQFVHGNNLVYNTCWEDPRLDRQALQLSNKDTVLVITSAGCNALDYLLAGAGSVHAVDMNPRQNALLELKASAIKNLDYPRFFQMFGMAICRTSRPFTPIILENLYRIVRRSTGIVGSGFLIIRQNRFSFEELQAHSPR